MSPNQGGLLSSSPWATYEFGYVDSNGNDAYDPGEPVVYDENRNGIVDIVPGTNDPTYAAGGSGGDRLLNGVNSTLVSGNLRGQTLKQDVKLRYIDGSSVGAYYNTTNGSWDAGGRGEHGETIVYDTNDNKIVDSNDRVVSGGPRAPDSTELGNPLQTVVFGGTFNKRATNTPCTVTNAQGQTISNFVEIHGVYPLSDSPTWRYETGDCATSYNGINGGGLFPNNKKLCDSTGNWQTFGFGGSCTGADRTACSHRVHFEMDHDWFAKGYCSPSNTVCNNSTLTHYLASGVSGGSVSLDIQGFVYWDPTEYDKAAHSFSGWEIHPFTAWRISPPTASFTFKPTSPMVDEIINFTATGSNGLAPYSFSWNFGDGSTATGKSVLHNYTMKGTYPATVSLTDSETLPETVTSSQSVTVNPTALRGSFTVTPESTTIGQSMTFTATVSGGTQPYSFSWAFGDASTGTGSTATHAYSTPDSYTIVLTVKDSGSPQQMAISQQTVTVTGLPPAPLSASFTLSPSSPQTSQQITFTGSASDGATPYSFSWTFGDGSSDTGSIVTHAYALAGTFTVILTAKDVGSPQQTATSQQSVTVINQPPPLTASFNYSPSAPSLGQQADFTAAASGGTAPYSFTWNFGDGSSGEGSTVSHTYTNPGSYNASIMVVDAEGHSATWSEAIEISPPQPAPPFWQQYWYLLAALITIGGLSTLWILGNRSKVLENNPKQHNKF